MNNYLIPHKPLVIRKATETWPALQKWTFEYLKDVVGDKTVPLYNSAKADPTKPINASAAEMKFGDYIDLIQNKPTDLRIFFLTR
ncbi:MAG: cupin-like domain-containing protein [Janthinobacterium lividum]